MKRGVVAVIAFMVPCLQAAAYEQATHAAITRVAYSRSVLTTGQDILPSYLGIPSFWRANSYFDILQFGPSGADAMPHESQDYENSMLDRLGLVADSSATAWLLR